MIYQKIYTSLTQEVLSDADLTAILNVSRLNNTRDQLSGLLVCHENRFLQVLEGPEDALKKCYARILADARHTRVRMLSHQMVTERLFSQWRMGFARPDELAAQTKDAVFSIYNLSQSSQADLGHDDKVARLIRSFLASFGLLGAAAAQSMKAVPDQNARGF